MSVTPSRPSILQPGEPAPWFIAPVIGGSPRWVFNTAGGRVCLLLLYGSSTLPAAAAAIDTVTTRRALFDDVQASFFGITLDPGDAARAALAQQLPGLRHFFDADRAISASYGAIPPADGDRVAYRPHFLLLDRLLRVVARFGIDEAGAALAATEAAIAAGGQDWAPVLTVPNVLEPALCRDLVARYDSAGGEPSGFMREIAGRTTMVLDPEFKRRSDYLIEDERVQSALMRRLHARLVPAIRQTFQFDATRIERYIVACYDADDGGHFRPHRDNTTKGTAHRRFAVTINLNDDYDGGDLRFPEFGPRTYRAPVGGAVVFSCSLLHEATPVTRGRRYAYLPFLYDEAAAKVREANAGFVEGGLAYTA